MTADDTLAAEYALGLLEGEDLLAARGRIAHDPAFAEAVAVWEARLAPLLDEVGSAAPPADLWTRIEAALPQDGEVIALRRSVRRWQWFSGLSAAAAAVLVFATMTFLAAPQARAPDRAPLVASVPITGTPLRLGLTYLPGEGELLVAADGLTADGVHDHELWLIADGAAPVSLGLVAPGQAVRLSVTEELAAGFHAGSTIAISREPIGGSPGSLPSGPVVASGTLTVI